MALEPPAAAHGGRSNVCACGAADLATEFAGGMAFVNAMTGHGNLQLGKGKGRLGVG